MRNNQGMHLERAKEADFPAIVDLVNVAYRGKGSVASWNIETGIIEGTRLTESLLREDLAAKPHAHFLVTRDPESRVIIGTAWLEPETAGVWYLGLFTIDPAVQKRNLGRALLNAAEEFAKAHGASKIRMGVLNVRDTLIAWYERRGYARTGATEAFPYDDTRFGNPLRSDLEFVILEKQI